jgi:hypothetical protein
MTAVSLANRIKTKYQSRTGESLTDTELLEEFCQAIIEEITQNGLVTATAMTSVSGGPVTGTGSIS